MIPHIRILFGKYFGDVFMQEQTTATRGLRQFIEGGVLGAVIGDALGVPGEFMERDELRTNPITGMRGGGAHGQIAGSWSDDTSMILATMDSLIRKGIDYEDQMKCFSKWLWDAEYTARDEVFDVGSATKSSIFKYVKGTPARECGELSEHGCGNGSLMRILPTALYLMGLNDGAYLDTYTAAIIHDTSKCTHAHPRCQMACGIYCSIVFCLYSGETLQSAVKAGINAALKYYKEKPRFSDVYRDFECLRTIETWVEEQIKSTGYVLHTLQAALWCLLNTDNYGDCVLKAANLGWDTDTTAAVAGGLAGAWYGAIAIPQEWSSATAKFYEIKTLCSDFYTSIMTDSIHKKIERS